MKRFVDWWDIETFDDEELDSYQDLLTSQNYRCACCKAQIGETFSELYFARYFDIETIAEEIKLLCYDCLQKESLPSFEYISGEYKRRI